MQRRLIEENTKELSLENFSIPNQECYYFKPLLVGGMINEYRECEHDKNTHQNPHFDMIHKLCRSAYCPILLKQQKEIEKARSGFFFE